METPSGSSFDKDIGHQPFLKPLAKNIGFLLVLKTFCQNVLPTAARDLSFWWPVFLGQCPCTLPISDVIFTKMMTSQNDTAFAPFNSSLKMMHKNARETVFHVFFAPFASGARPRARGWIHIILCFCSLFTTYTFNELRLCRLCFSKMVFPQWERRLCFWAFGMS